MIKKSRVFVRPLKVWTTQSLGHGSCFTPNHVFFLFLPQKETHSFSVRSERVLRCNLCWDPLEFQMFQCILEKKKKKDAELIQPG